MKPSDLTVEILALAIGTTFSNAQRWVGPIAQTWQTFAIDTKQRQAYYLAHIGHESLGLERIVESFNYSTERLVAVFGRHRITQEQAKLYGRNGNRAANQEAIANIVYGGAWGLRNLGNRNPGDGWKYRGRGPIQTTGCANCIKTTLGLRKILHDVPDFEQEPQKLELPIWGAMASGLYWAERGLNALADAGDMEAQTQAINGGLNGLADRHQRFDDALAQLP